MRAMFVLAAAGLMCVAAPAWANQPAAPQGMSVPEAAMQTNDPEAEVVCKSMKITGSRLGKERICKSRKQWDEEAANTRRGVSDQQIRGLQVDGTRGSGG